MSITRNQAGVGLTLLALMILHTVPTSAQTICKPLAPCYSQCNCTIEIINGCHVFVEDCDFKIELSLLDPELQLNRSTNGEDGHYTYFHPHVACKAFLCLQPASLDQLQNVVRFALRNNLSIREGHTRDSTSTDGVLVDMRKIKHHSFNSKTKLLTVGDGMELSELVEAARSHGRGLTGVSGGGALTPAGYSGTNLEGTGTLVDHTVSFKFVDWEGNVGQLREGDKDFQARNVKMGQNEIIYEFTLRTIELTP